MSADSIAPSSEAETPARPAAPRFDVFISYSHIDKATADATCATLEQAGIRCWIAPRDITPGDEWGAAIVKAIDQCSAMVLIFSSNANSSKQIRREVERAVNAGVPIIPVRIENVAPTEAMAYFMSTVHWLDAMTAPLEGHLQRLAQSIKALLQAEAVDNSYADPRDARENTGTTTGAGPGKVKAKPMFAEIMNFSYQRTGKQAFGWYLIYLAIGIVLAFAVGQMAGMFGATIEDTARIGFKAGQLSAIPYHLALAVLLLWHRAKDASGIMLALAGIVLSVLLGSLGGLIPLAFLSRRPVIERARVPFARARFAPSAH
jgi:hypothetical protein